MKVHFHKLLVALTLALTLGLVGLSDANAGHCVKKGGYWHNGHWIPRHMSCNGGDHWKHCRWVGGFHRNGHWVPRHKVCGKGWW